MYELEIQSHNGAYPVVVGAGLDTGALARGVKAPCRALLVSDSTVFPLHGAGASASLAGSGFAVQSFVFPSGEASKNLDTFGSLLDCLAGNGFSRGDLVVALGGGVVGDLAGFAASVYMRGIDYVQLPTTLISAVDASVGGKTGVDLPRGKNLAGTFYSPKGVFIDVRRLETLPGDVLSDGFAEAIKTAMIADRDLLEALAKGGMDTADIITRCVRIKAGIVMRDERERGERQLLNFGHTIGHAIEALSGYAVSHGSAVAMGMYRMTALCEQYGLTEEPCLAALAAALKRYGLPCGPYDVSDAALAQAMLGDKKRRGEALNIVIPKAIGRAAVYSLPVDRIASFIGGTYTCDLG